VDRVVSNPPFGKQLATPEEIGPLYVAAAREWDRVLKPGGRAVLLVMEFDALQPPLRSRRWALTRQLKVRLLGQLCVMSAWEKPDWVGG
jgi:23S rRNA G2445 N2-methylase RlmL